LRPGISSQRAFTLVELLFAMSLFIILATMAVPPVLANLDASRTRAAARFLASRLALARARAVAQGAIVGLHFTDSRSGILFITYIDGDGDGVRTTDISSGVDPVIEEPTALAALFPGVTIALTIDGISGDAVQFGSSRIASFTPDGTASSGSVYVRGKNGAQYAVRVLGATARARVLRYDLARRDFVDAY
jgi:type II secretory pathway pseudopilin PulG